MPIFTLNTVNSIEEKSGCMLLSKLSLERRERMHYNAQQIVNYCKGRIQKENFTVRCLKLDLQQNKIPNLLQRNCILNTN